MTMSVFFDARLAVRGLGIASATERLLEALVSRGDMSVVLNASAHGWTRRGKAETLLRSGLLDVSPRLDPRAARADVVHFFGNTAPRRPDGRTVVTVHDLMMLSSTSPRSKLFRELLVPGLGRQTGPVVAISSRTADALWAKCGIGPDRVTVIPHGRRVRELPAGPREHILMFGGSSDSRKRVSLGIAAYAQYAGTAGKRAFPLVVAGRSGISAEDLSVARAANVRVVPNPDRDEVDRLMARAACLIYPSAQEGYGLPILEAGEVGTPVVLDATADIPREPRGAHVTSVEGPDLRLWGDAVGRAANRGTVVGAVGLIPTWEEVAQLYFDVYATVER